MNFDIDKHTVYLVTFGSRAYGTSTPESDLDVRGFAVAPKSHALGFAYTFEQCERSVPADPEKGVLELDSVIYDIRKFCNLAADSNPNVIEALFVDESDIRVMTSAGKLIRDNRNLFLSKKARHTFSGYAISQLKRIKTHKGYLVNPPTHKPTREEFGLGHGGKITPDMMGAFDKLVESGTEVSPNVMELVQKEKLYKSAADRWAQYEGWKATRNEKRSELERKFGYDCYTDDTEFLTDRGWLSFDQINENDRLATVFVNNTGLLMGHRPALGVEYQLPTNRLDGTFSGNLYNLFGYHTDTLVTPNHRMLYRSQERVSKKNGPLVLEEAAGLPDTFQCLRYPTAKKTCFSNKKEFEGIDIPRDAYLRLMGWYLSDGCATFRNGKLRSVRVSQKKNGKLYSSMKKFSNRYKFSLYHYLRKPNAVNPVSITEAVLNVTGPLAQRIVADCGFTTTKHIPRWVYGLSGASMNILLDALILGDGTKSKPDNSMIYYSKSKSIADDVQELALLAGNETSLYGPYTSIKFGKQCEMYQVHVNKTRDQFKTFIRSSNIKTMPVVNQRIVCFTVPNGTLITRRNGHVGIHGNCKHGMHLVRLLKMCREILEGKGVLVKRPDADELREIRAGAWSYEKLIEFAEKEDAAMQDLYVSSTLPKTPDIARLNELCVEAQEMFWSEGK